MASNYLKHSRHGSTFYFRRRVPDDIRLLLGKPYLVKTLGTGKRREAIILARAFATRTDSLFHHIRTMPDHKNNNLDVELIFKLDFNDLGGLKSVHIEADTPEEQEQANAMLNNTLQSLQAPSQRKEVGIRFSDAVEEYLSHAQIKATTRQTYNGRLENAIAFFGADVDIRHIEQGELSTYARQAAKTIADPTTATHTINTFATFLNWFRVGLGWGHPLTTKTLLPKIDTPDSDDRDEFKIEQLALVFKSAAQYRETEPHKYWVTLAVAMTGCRIEELAQVNLHADLKRTASGVWYLDLNGKADPDGTQRKSLKNKASWRHVPIHSQLERHGFVEYLLAQKDAGFSRPFESGWKPRVFDEGKAFKWSHYVTNWGGRELNKLKGRKVICDPEDKLSYFHSMRHTFSKTMGHKDKQISTEVCEASMGHKYAGGDRERYQKLKSDPDQLAQCGLEPGLREIAALLDTL